MIVLVIYKVLLNENGLFEMIFRLRYMFDMKNLKYIAVACISFKVSSGLGLAVQTVGKHVEKAVTQEYDEEASLGTLLSLLKTCLVIMCIACMFVSFCAWKIVRARPDIDDLYDVLHGMVHDTNEARRSIERMGQAYAIIANQRMNAFELRLLYVQQALGRVEDSLRTRVAERQFEPEPEESQVHEMDDDLLSLGVPSDFSGNS